METLYIVIAQNATRNDDDSATSATDIFNVITAESLPFVSPPFDVAFQILVDNQDARKELPLVFRLINKQTGEKLTESRSPIRSIKPYTDLPPFIMGIVTVQDILFTVPGTYEVQVEVKGQLAARALLYIRHEPQMDNVN